MIGTYATKSELHAGAVIGPGLVVSDLGGIGIPDFAIIGSNCTFLGPALLTLGGMENIDLAHDRIRLGSGCIIGQGARLLGPIELGDGAQIKPNAVVITSFAKPGQIIAGIPARRRGTVPPDLVLNWNPLRGRPLGTVS
jgi:serine O-acetyltransferase